MSSVSVNRNGKRMVVWHDNRNNNFDIYSARSLDGYECNNISCQNKMVDYYSSNISECLLSFNFTASSSSNYIFSIEFYEDAGLTNLFKTIISDADNLKIWFIDGSSFDSCAIYSGSDYIGVALSEDREAIISYSSDSRDGIFDRVLYTKLVSVES